jgi:hypothetical protein
VEELIEASGKILRGCQEHFRAGVTRVSRISGAVPIESKDRFVARALSLLEASDSDEYRYRAALIARDYPKLKSWLDWWMRPAHASMLFSSERKMDIEIWDMIPKTTNAEEAMHWKLYSACGRNHSLLEGLKSLAAVAMYYERKFEAASGEYYA